MIPFRLSSRPSRLETCASIGLALAGIVAANFPIYVNNISYFADTLSVLAPLVGGVAAMWIAQRLLARGVFTTITTAVVALVVYVALLIFSVAFSMSQL
jgi:hypothetical protein